MNTFLFIYAITAGSFAGWAGGAHPVWQGQWQYATKFDRPEYCHKAAANLGLKKDEYRCIDIAGGMQ